MYDRIKSKIAPQPAAAEAAPRLPWLPPRATTSNLRTAVFSGGPAFDGSMLS